MDQMDSPSPLGHQESSSDEGRIEFLLMETRNLSWFISRRDWHNAVELCKSNPRLLSRGMANSKDTALHVAINEDRVDFVEKLVVIIESTRTNQALTAQNNKGETPLHCAAARGSVRMCELILRAGDNMREDLLGIANKWDENPIFVAVVHNRKPAFIYLYDAAYEKPEDYLVIHRGTAGDADRDAGANADRDTVLHSAIRRGHVDLAFYIIKKCPQLSDYFNAKGVSPLELLARTPSLFRSSYNLSWWKHIIYFCIQVDPLKYDPNPTSKTNPDRKSSNIFSPPSAHKRQDKKEEAEPVMNPKKLSWNIFTKIKRVKEKYTWSLQVLDQLLENYCNEEIMKHAIDLESGSDHDSFEMLAVYRDLARGGGDGGGGDDCSDKVENITNKALLAAAETGVIEVVDKILRRFPRIMQMQCEVTWYEYVKSFVPSHYLFLKNGKDKTPEQIFPRDHKDLVEKGTAWLKDTSQSCSVVAALVAGVSFATSKSIPGSVDAKGKPTLEEHPAFQLFAISGLIGLGFSVTALIMFLSILTSRKQPIDFKRNLPFKLLLGLSSLFVSIASMFISFCASHFFVLEDKFKKGIFPLYAVTCLPISFYAIAQFPLYLNLMKAIVKDVPQSQKYVQL